jgi:hypothetical protein
MSGQEPFYFPPVITCSIAYAYYSRSATFVSNGFKQRNVRERSVTCVLILGVMRPSCHVGGCESFGEAEGNTPHFHHRETLDLI